MNKRFLTYCNIMAIIWLFFLHSGCTGSSQRRIAPQLQPLYNQLTESCKQAKIYQKQVLDLNQSPSTKQDSTIVLEDFRDDPETCPLLGDLIYAYSQHFEQEGIKEYFDSQQVNDTLIATIKEEYAESIDLQVQKMLMDGDKFLYFESRISKDSWLYELSIHIKVNFGEDGLYRDHSLDITNSVPWLDKSFVARVHANAQY